jgi:DNA repair exonuclease SbcCD ATPase subunit
MIRFQVLRIEGFGCYNKSFEFNLDSPGLTVISGDNGSGKSTIFSALTWALFGKGLKNKSEVVTWEFKQPQAWRGTKVEILFRKGDSTYQVIRCKKYKEKVLGSVGKDRLILVKDGDVVTGSKDKRDIQFSIEKVLGYSYELFISSIIFPQKVKRFIEEAGADKKKLLEEIFSLEWLSKALEIAKEEKKEVIIRLASQKNITNKLETQIQGKEEFLFHVQENKKVFDQDKVQKVEKLKSEIEKHTSSTRHTEKDVSYIIELIMETQDYIKGAEEKEDYIDLDSNREKLAKTENLIQKAQSEISDCLQKIKHYEQAHDATCDECGQPLKDQERIELLDSFSITKNTLKASLAELSKISTRLIHKVENGKSIQHEIRRRSKILNESQSELRILDEYNRSIKESKIRIQALQEELDRVNQSEFKDISPSIIEEITKLKSELKEQDSKARSIENEQRLLDWVISEPLSINGLKAYILETMIKRLNYKLSYYAKFINFEVQLEIDMETVRKDIRAIITRDENPVLFEDLSGGESQLVNVAIAFSMNDLLSSTKKVNIAVFDELFEGLDRNNVEIITDLLQDKANGLMSLYVITHKLDFSPRNCEVLKFPAYVEN